MAFRIKGISAKFALYLFLLLSAGGGGNLYFSYRVYSQFVERVFHEEVEKRTDFVAASLASPIWTFNEHAIQGTLDALIDKKRENYLVRIEIQNAQGEVLYQAHQGEPADHRGMELFFSSSPIFYEGRLIGELRTWSNLRELRAQIWGKMLSFLVFGIAVSLVLMLVAYFVLHRMIGRPLRVLKGLAEEVLTGDYGVKKVPNLEKEFETLSNALQDMIDGIRRRDQELRAYNVNLEVLIDQRTAELDDQRAKLTQASKMATLGEFAGNIAHEINNPLAVIGGNAQIIAKAVANQDLNKIMISQEKITNMVSRITKIVTGLRTFARDGSQDKMTIFDAELMLEIIKDLSQKRIEGKGIHFNIVNELGGVRGFGREVQISQILMNLINNSSDAIESFEDKWIELRAFNEGHFMYFSVTDSGKGIPPDVQEKMLNPFFTTKPVGKGTGLGLSISLGIAKDHQGDLIYSENKGHTCFTLKIPRSEIKKEAA